MALLPISTSSTVLCQRDPASTEAAGEAVTAGNTAGVTALPTSGVAGIFTTTAMAICVVCDKLTAKGNGVR